MKKHVAALWDQHQQECLKAQKFIAELNLSAHPLSATISNLADIGARFMAMSATDSANSHLPPSQDPHREKGAKNSNGKKPGGQHGRKGTRLLPFETPDKIIQLEVDPNQLTPDAKLVGLKKCQVVEIESKRLVIEYQSEIYRLADGSEVTADFPDGVSAAIQYGQSVKASVAYLSAFQLMPYARIGNLFSHQLHIPLSEGSIFNFLKETYERLGPFEWWLKNKLSSAPLLHLDETGININTKTHWIHTMATSDLTLLLPHAKRGREAMNEFGVLPGYSGLVCHDCWSSYFAYDDATHVLCNAHIMRELKGAEEKYGCRWAKRMHALFKAMYKVCKDGGGSVPPDLRKKLRTRYRTILTLGEKECELAKDGGKQKRTKPQNLLIRLREHEESVLRFLEDPAIPFTNNLAENALRMAKVQQKISGCFRTMEGAKFFCRIRSYISTCMKNGVSPAEALGVLFNGNLPDFIDCDAQPALAGE